MRALANASLASAAVALTEAAVAATLVLSNALRPADAAAAAAALYTAFAASCALAPHAVTATRPKAALAFAAAAYVPYVAAFALRLRRHALVGMSVLGGLAGAVMWTAQGVYLSRNAAALAAEVQSRTSSDPPAASMHGKALDLLAGVFTVVFTLSLSAGKQVAALSLSVRPDRPGLAYALLCALAVVATAMLMCVRDLPPAPAERAGEAALRDASRTLSARVCARAASLTRRGSLAHAFRDPRLLLLTPTNVAFGLMTSFFPAKVGGLAKAAEGVASVGWYFALAAASSTLLTLLAMVASQKLRSARAMTILIGAASFGTASASLAVCPTASCAASLTHLQLFLCFICYGAGVAAWQSGCMALVGDMSQSEPHAAFALLKFTSGFASAVGFFVFPTMGARSVARVCLGAVLVGALCVSLLLRRYGANGTSGGSANKDERPLVPVVPLSPRAGDTSTRSSGEKLMQMEPFRS